MASLEEVWGKPFPKKHYDMTSKYDAPHEKRDPEKEGRVFPTPIHRTNAALQRHKKTIDDISKSLPIVGSDEEGESNYGPARVPATRENFTSTKTSYSNPYYPSDSGTSFSYAPPSFQEAAYDIKLDRIMRMLPAQRQTLLFSATFSNEIRKLGRTYLKNPVEIEVAKRNATADTVTQIAYAMAGEAKRAAVVHLVKSRGLKQVIVFSNTKIGTSRLARQLELDGVRAESIHGDKSQADRMKALEAFKAGELEVLVATDVAARGLDVAGVPCVINYDLPHTAEDYVHRIGRTGRAGASGEAISFFSPSEEKYLIDIEKLIKAPVTRAVLQIPGELLVRAPLREDARPTRSARSGERGGERSGSGGGSARPSRYSAPVKPIDEFFLKPYEPSASAVAAAAQAPAVSGKKSATQVKRTVGLLLGGAQKKSEVN
jgi:superfamily II DNA/RNA helicase